MKPLSLLSLVTVLLAFSVHAKTDTPKYVSQTFQDILNRVVERDKESGAILQVMSKEDSPAPRFYLEFSLVKDGPRDEAVVILKRSTRTETGVFEMYRLRIDTAMQEELEKQHELLVDQEKHAVASRAKRGDKIANLTDHQLKVDMKSSQVKSIKGKPQRVQASDASSMIWIYDDMVLHFQRGLLMDVGLVGESK